jgi:hypothetical protein
MSYTVEELDELFRSNALRRIGMGSRRACYQLPCGKLCVKSYRSDEEILEGKHPGRSNTPPLLRSVVKEIQSFRFDEKRNTSCQEYRYWENLKKKIPSALLEAFPETMEMFCVPSRGWCLVEELIENSDGTPIVKFLPAWRDSGEDGRKRLAEALETFEDFLVRHSIRFFDPQTVMVQRTSCGFRLRVPDFEPATRTLIPFEAIFPALVRKKIRRRFARFRRAVGIV